MKLDTIIQGDALKTLKKLPDESIDCIITSPPYYGLRDYGVEGQIGLEKSMDSFLKKMLALTLELKRVLKPEGTMWWNHGDNYSHRQPMGNQGKSGGRATRRFTPHGIPGRVDTPEKSLTLQAHRLAIRMIDEQGWILRNQIIWYKPNAMPSSVADRFGVDYEPVFFFTKSKRYFFEKPTVPSTTRKWASFNMRVRDVKRGKTASDQYKASDEEVERGDVAYDEEANEDRGMRTVWEIPTAQSPEAHFATFPERLVEPMILAGCPQGGVVLDPFMGAGTTAMVALKNRRRYLGVELNPEYIAIAKKRIQGLTLPLSF